MNQTQSKRLLNVAVALRDAAKAKKLFDMGTFAFDDFNTAEAAEVQPLCGTPACALGHYASRSDLQRTFKFKVENVTYPFDQKVRQQAHLMAGSSTVGFDSNEVLDHFGISTDESEDLFGSDGCGLAKTPIQAAKYIERFVKNKAKK